MQTLYALSGAVVQKSSYCDLPLTGCQGGAYYALPSVAPLQSGRVSSNSGRPYVSMMDGVGITNTIDIGGVHTVDSLLKKSGR